MRSHVTQLYRSDQVERWLNRWAFAASVLAAVAFVGGAWVGAEIGDARTAKACAAQIEGLSGR